jgi:hypothetical protein
VIYLNSALRAWGTAEFEAVFKLEVAQLSHDQLPLQQGLSMGSDVLTSSITTIFLEGADLGEMLRIRTGIMYQSVIAGCSCADDPTSISENNEYVELLLDINKASALTTVTLI